MHDFFAVRERYEHAPFTVSCIVQVLNYFVTLGNVSVPITVNKDNNAVVHVIGAERVTSQVVKLELSDYWVSMSFITYMLYSQPSTGIMKLFFITRGGKAPMWCSLQNFSHSAEKFSSGVFFAFSCKNFHRFASRFG